MKNILPFAINVQNSHHIPQCALQLVCKNRVFFVLFDIHISFLRAAASKVPASNSSPVSTFIFVKFFLEIKIQLVVNILSLFITLHNALVRGLEL